MAGQFSIVSCQSSCIYMQAKLENGPSLIVGGLSSGKSFLALVTSCVVDSGEAREERDNIYMVGLVISAACHLRSFLPTAHRIL